MLDSDFKARLQSALTKFRELPRPPLEKCMWWRSECDQAILSHSISRACLSRISQDGHVVQFKPEINYSTGQPKIIAALIGINKASVFPGFCAEHDSLVFHDVDEPITTCSRRQCDLLVLRSLCREAYTKYKIASSNIAQGMVEDHPTPFGRFTMDMALYALDLMADIYAMEEALDNNTHLYNHYMIEFNCTPNIVASATFSPQLAFDGTSLGYGLEWITFNIIPTQSGGIAILSWERSKSLKALSLLDSMLNIDLCWLSDILLKFAIDNTENAFYDPAWWQGLTLHQQSNIIQRYTETLGNHHCDLRGLYLTNGVPLVNWTPIKREPVTL